MAFPRITPSMIIHAKDLSEEEYRQLALSFMQAYGDHAEYVGRWASAMQKAMRNLQIFELLKTLLLIAVLTSVLYTLYRVAHPGL